MSMKRKPEQSKLWAGRFRGKTDPKVEAFTSSLAIDRRLSRHDIAGSIAHCRTLERAGVLTRSEADKLVAGLKQVEKEIAGGRFRFMPAHEDVHMAIEARLTELVGEVGGKLHTGRSRNDQVALDLRLYLRDAVKDLLAGLRQFQESLVALAQRELSVVMPGYTHLQRAQPVLFAHHLLAYVEMAERDKGRLRDALRRINVLPLGSGALAGTNYPLDREYTARLLGFPVVSQNSLDAVSDRDFVVETLAALELVMAHASRFAERLVPWSAASRSGARRWPARRRPGFCWPRSSPTIWCSKVSHFVRRTPSSDGSFATGWIAGKTWRISRWMNCGSFRRHSRKTRWMCCRWKAPWNESCKLAARRASAWRAGSRFFRRSCVPRRKRRSSLLVIR